MKKGLIFVVILVTLFLSGCSWQISKTAYDDLITKLEKMDYQVTEKDEKKEFLQGERKKLTLNKNVKIWVYLYESKEKMEEDAACIQPGGYGYDNGRNAVDVEWVLPPHFFKADNMIVLYVGENLDLINALREIVSEPFAESTE